MFRRIIDFLVSFSIKPRFFPFSFLQIIVKMSSSVYFSCPIFYFVFFEYSTKMANLNLPCTLVISSDSNLISMDVQSIRACLESKDVAKKREGIKAALMHMANGKDMSEILMSVIRDCVTVDDHELTKLLQLYVLVAVSRLFLGTGSVPSRPVPTAN